MKRLGWLTAVLVAASASPAAAYPVSGFSIWTIAGNGTFCATAPACGDGGAATSASLNIPDGLAVDAFGNVYVGDSFDNAVRVVTPSGIITRIAGTGAPCTTPPDCGDGDAATRARLSMPAGVAVDSAGNVFVADLGDHEVRKVAPDGTITRLAGTGTPCTTPPNCGDGGAATSAQLNEPVGVAVDRTGGVYIADFRDDEVRRVSPTGTIRLIAGDGSGCATPPNCGDGGAATAAQLNRPQGMAVDGAGNVYISDTADDEIRKVSPGGTISRIAGTGTPCRAVPDCGEGIAATNAMLNSPWGIVVDPTGNVYFADSGDNEVRRVAPGGTIIRIAGTGVQCTTAPSCGDGGAATAGELSDAGGLALDAAGNLYIGDDLDQEVRWLTGAQAGPVGATGPAGMPGIPGGPGTPGAVGAPGPGGKLVLVAFKGSVARARVTVRYALTGDASITLAVKPLHGRPVVVTRARGRAGLGRLTWNRKLHGMIARHGTYKLIVTAALGTDRASSALTIRL